MEDNFNDKLEKLLPKEHDEIKDKATENQYLMFFIILIIAILFGYFKFQKAQDNIILSPFHQNQVLSFNEIKNISIELLSKNRKEIINQTITTDFLVTINLKKKLNYFGVINYLYNATLIIVNKSYDEKINQGLYLDEENKIKQIMTHPEDYSQSICKFSFYENGSLAEIYLTNDMDFYNATSMVDLIENIIPKISRKIYNEFNGDNIKYIYEDKKDIKILSEIQEKKDLEEKYSKITFKGSQFNKNIKRRYKKNKIENIAYESEIKLFSRNEKEKDLFDDIGLNSIKVNSDINIISNKNDKYLIKAINSMLRKINFVESQKLNKNKMNEKNYESQKENNDISTNKNELVNLRLSRVFEYHILTVNILGKSIEFNLLFDFNNYYNHGLPQITLQIVINGEKNAIKDFYPEKNSLTLEGDFDFPLIPIYFWFGIPLKISLEASFEYSFNFSYDEIKMKVHGGLSGKLSADAPYIEIGIKGSGKLFHISGNVKYESSTNELLKNIKSLPCDFSLYAFVEIPGGKYKKQI
jgi:hypothetical protein